MAVSAAALVVPLRAFAVGMERLADRLDPDARAALARRLADTVLDAGRGLPTVVVSSAPEVVEWARARDVDVIDDPGSLDTAAEVGRRWARDAGLQRVVVAHADLPDARSFDALTRDGEIGILCLVPDHRCDGTPVLSTPTDVDIRFAYGPGSFARHCREARRLGLGLRVVRAPELAFDVDLPSDLDRLASRTA